MSHQQRPGRQRVGPLFGVVLVVVGAVAALTPVVPNARALDPTPDPGATVDPTADPTPAPDPTPTPVTEPTPDPTPDPTPVPEPTPTDPAPAVTPDPTTAPAPTEEPAPSLDPGATPDPSSSPEPTPATSDPPSPTPSAGPPGPYVGHAWVETVNRQGQVIARGRLDEPLTDAERFTVYRIRFQLVNAGDTEETVRPAIEVSGDSLAWTPVPQVDPVADLPFYAASDDGRVFKARRVAIDRQDLRLQASDDPLGAPVAGVSSAGRTTTGAITLPAHSFTEVEFAVRATVDAEWLASYAFRLADGGSPLATRSANARITMIGRPPLDLSPGQRRGKAVRDPVPLYRLDPVFGSMEVIPVSRSGVQAHGGLGAPLAAPGPFEDPHLTYSLTSDACAACHSSHIAQGPSLTLEAAPQSTLCFTCHDGTGAVADVQSDWTSPALPANDPATSSWYSHPATEIAGQPSGEVSFEGVLNRRAQCADCHQPHLADATRPVMTTGGWSASGAIGGAAGVSVTNGAAGTAPAYTLNRTSTLEYQLCFKCHSGYTVLPAQDPSHPSRWELDKAIELNPANVSYHPVEAAGKNQTNAMARSLLGSSPFKLWALEPSSTVRCVSCHGDSAVASAAPRPAADASLDNHAGPNRGILLAPYRDRSLLGPLEMYDAADFSLCYVCHAEAPMVDGTGDVRTDTNFNWHGLHTNEIWLNGTGSLDIDVAGAGQGNAVCAECHFRIHGTALAVGGQTPARGLVNFAPDVQPLNGVLRFDAWTPGTQGSCTLTCHGRPHNGFRYEGVP